MGSSTPTPEDRIVRVAITKDHIAVMDPALPVLESVLQYRQRTFVAGGPLGYQEIVESVSLCEFDNKGRLCFAAGLLPKVRPTLLEHGYRVVIQDQRKPGSRLAVDLSVIDSADAGIKPLCREIVRETLGQIEAHNDKDVIDKMLLVPKLFPNASVVVAVATRQEAWKWCRQLQTRLEEKVGLAISGLRRKGERWLVGTFGSVPREQVGDFDILLLPQGEESTGERACEMVAEMHFRRIGCIP